MSTSILKKYKKDKIKLIIWNGNEKSHDQEKIFSKEKIIN